MCFDVYSVHKLPFLIIQSGLHYCLSTSYIVFHSFLHHVHSSVTQLVIRLDLKLDQDTEDDLTHWPHSAQFGPHCV